MKHLVILAGAALMAVGSATDFPEVEANDTKAAANLFTLAAGDAITGATTGASTITPGIGSADYFRVKTAPDALGIYQYRLVLTSAVAGHTGTIRGLSQTAGAVGTLDNTVQTTSTTTTPPRRRKVPSATLHCTPSARSAASVAPAWA